ncbi:hypothetical protein NDU88_007440 [Pleurodeles waltl]|uniref:Uncharacterized protein n=1 Tax=Pleurodeles waltl TaxID=8319 RepID=A0AAV7SSB5_PLEWA|nr:hypothetical protein NDU88_007440 [Pleurodeles waltl]
MGSIGSCDPKSETHKTRMGSIRPRESRSAVQKTRMGSNGSRDPRSGTHKTRMGSIGSCDPRTCALVCWVGHTGHETPDLKLLAPRWALPSHGHQDGPYPRQRT